MRILPVETLNVWCNVSIVNDSITLLTVDTLYVSYNVRIEKDTNAMLKVDRLNVCCYVSLVKYNTPNSRYIKCMV